MQQVVSDTQKSTIASFTDLKAWQQGHKLVLSVYRLTKTFPSDEQFVLTNQLRRAVVSITSNIAEGFSRQTKADKLHFYSMAHGSCTEVQNQILIARDVKYAPSGDIQKIAEQSVLVHKLITGLMKALRDGKGVRV
jgi:four helix bundle protein